MFPFRNSPIRRKLRVVMMATALLSIVLTAAGYLGYEYVTFREILADDLISTARIVSQNSTAALVFQNRDDAAQALRALQSQPRVVAGAMYDNAGALVAKYVREGSMENPPASPGPDSYSFASGRLVLFRPIKLKGERLGTMYLQSDLQALYDRFISLVGITLAVLIGSLLAAFGLASLLQSRVSRPILGLVETARAISERQDYAVRAVKASEDELGLLAETFNQMLERIQEREANLHQASDQIRKLNAGLETRVRLRTAQLEATNKELEAFSYSVSHDLRAPLRHIDGYAEMLLTKTKDSADERVIRYAQVISDSAKRMGRLIDELLVFSRMGRTEMQRSRVDMQGLVGEVLNDLKEETEGRKIAWNIQSLPEVAGDPAMLKLVLMNLIANAVKYTGKREDPAIEIGYTPLAGETEFFIRDNGAGFDMKYADKLFGVFQRLHSSDEYEGIGIGLANVHRIITRHGGRVRAEGAVGEGATFYFSLPTVTIGESLHDHRTEAYSAGRG